MLGSFGGLRTNIETQVIDVNNQVIPRLYAAGAIMSGMYTGEFYHACGWSVLGTLHWGRKAGRNAALTRPWTTQKLEHKVDVSTHASSSSKKEENKTTVSQETHNFKPGKYTATASGRNGNITVQVDVDDHKIKAVNIEKNSETAGVGDVPIKELPKRIISAQSTKVDVVSGASVTSKGILSAVQKCIDQAIKQ